MIDTLEKSKLKTVKLIKDTWLLEVPAEICEYEGFAEGTMVSLTFRNGGIQTAYIQPTEESRQSAQRFINKYGDFMKEMDNIDD